MGKEKKNESRLVDRKATKQVRIDALLHKELKIEAAKRSATIRDLVEEGLAEVLAIEGS